MNRPLFVSIASFTLLAFSIPNFAQQPPQEATPPPQTQTPAFPPAAAQQPPTFIKEVNLVDVLLTVLDRRNKLVPELEKGDFKISDDNVGQEIRFFSKQSDLP